MARERTLCRRYKAIGHFEVEADFTQAKSPIHVRFEEQERFWPTPFLVADAKHDRRRAEILVARYAK